MTLKDAATFQLLFLYSVHGTSLLWRSTVALTYLTFHSNHRPISHRFRDKRGENRQFSYPVYIAPAEGVTVGIGYRRRVRKKTTRMMGLPDGRKSFKICLTTQYQRVTDGRTDGYVVLTNRTILCVARVKHSRFGLAWSRPRADRGLSRPTRLGTLPFTPWTQGSSISL